MDAALQQWRQIRNELSHPILVITDEVLKLCTEEGESALLASVSGMRDPCFKSIILLSLVSA